MLSFDCQHCSLEAEPPRLLMLQYHQGPKTLTSPRAGIKLVRCADILPAALRRHWLSLAVEVPAWLSYHSAGTSEHVLLTVLDGN